MCLLLSIVFDPAAVRARQPKGETVIYGDAMNEPILRKAHTEVAKIVVISIGETKAELRVWLEG